MKKKLCLLLIICIGLQSAQQTFAQANKKHSYSVNFGPEIIFPESGLRRTHNTGLGGSIKGEYTFGKHGSVTLNTGLSVLSGRDFFDGVNPFPVKNQSLIAIPVKAGVRYYFGNFYLLGEGGVVFLNKYTNSTRPLLSAGAGDKFRIGGNKIDISLRQEIWFSRTPNFNTAVLRVAYEIVW